VEEISEHIAGLSHDFPVYTPQSNGNPMEPGFVQEENHLPKVQTQVFESFWGSMLNFGPVRFPNFGPFLG